MQKEEESMKAPIATSVLALAVIAAGGIGVDKAMTALRVQTLTADVTSCRLDIASDAYLTGGLRSQADAAAAVRVCKVAPGTKLFISLVPGSQEFTITGTSADAPGYRVSLNNAAGGTIKVVPPTA